MTPKPLTDVEAVVKVMENHIFTNYGSSDIHGERSAARVILRLLKRRGWYKEPMIPVLWPKKVLRRAGLVKRRKG